MKYEPRPDSVAFRALAHMETLFKGSEISSAMLATAIRADASSLHAQLERAVEVGRLFRRQKGGNSRSPIFWSLVNHSEEEARAPAPRTFAPTPSPAYPPLPGLDLDLGDEPKHLVTKVQAGDADPSIRETIAAICETNPLQSVWAQPAASTPAAVFSRIARGPTSRSEIDAATRSIVESVSSTEAKPEVLSPRAVLNGLAEAYCFDATPSTVCVARGLTPDSADIRVDGTLEIRAFEAPTMLLTRQQARQLVDYLNAIDLDVLEDEVAR